MICPRILTWREKMWSRQKYSFLIIALIFCLQVFHIHIILVEATDTVYIVYMGEKLNDEPVVTKRSHHQLLTTLLGSKQAARSSMLYSYKHGFSGIAARLTQSQAEEIAGFPGVVQVIPNRIHKIHTTRSWDFLGLQDDKVKGLLAESNHGKGIILGVIDSGVWPEAKSFNDNGMDEVPVHWKGICQVGERFNSSNCNKKLIGARWFVKGLTAHIKSRMSRTPDRDFLSPRDGMGHGTHTASTAAGSPVEEANYQGLASGIARGGAPHAHLAIYKACWVIIGCTDADILKAFDKAIHDKVDILSLSIGLSVPSFPYVDHRESIAIGSFHAMAEGITVVSSAGNDGPLSHTVVNTAPWLITVAATTIDRIFAAAITLGNNQTFWGQSKDTRFGYPGFSGITYSGRVATESADDTVESCQTGGLNSTLASGKIILCFFRLQEDDLETASQSVREAGGIGLIYAQAHDDRVDSCDIPCVKVDFEAGMQILSYIRRARSPTAKLTSSRTVIGKWVSPRVASFSSRGPSSITPQVLKPDIAAPGVDILAAYRPLDGDNSNSYYLKSGTSMACPHVAGIAALIKSAHPSWSPAAIRSALVTTASQRGTDGTGITDGGPTEKIADPFDIGGGHVNPNKAVDPGLIYNISMDGYVQFLCSIGHSSKSITSLRKTITKCNPDNKQGLDLNLPSITIPYLKGSISVKRTVTNVGPSHSVYKAIVQAPSSIEVVVEPRVLRFNSSVQVLSFKVEFLSTRSMQRNFRFGSLTWTDGQHMVRIPIAVRALEFGSYKDL